ncbi:hypothetical protein CANCADRAFT_14246, partial [Tortispora caseinolytica NRRL Y-17796]
MSYKFDIDRPIRHLQRHDLLAKLPPYISRFLGYRDPSEPHKGDTAIHDTVLIVWIFFSTFIGVLIPGMVFHFHTIFSDHNAPLLIASFGASAILLFNAIEIPVSQPRNFICSHLIGCIVGISLRQLFWMTDNPNDYVWIACAIACSVCSLVMYVTKTIHPPGGATALLPLVDEQIGEMTWFFIPVVLTSLAIMLGTALVLNNFRRRYPVFWWFP